MGTDTCSASSFAAGEPLAGTATSAHRWLLVEARGAWARDVDETELPARVRAAADGFDGRVQLIRRPDRRDDPQHAYVAESREDGGSLRGVDSLEDLGHGEPIDGPLLLVCCHGRRDPCCARLGTPVFDALRAHAADDAVWQSSHLGGHRFAANVLVLPDGLCFGRLVARAAPTLVDALDEGQLPLEHLRGRTAFEPAQQAAEILVRRELGLTGLDDLRLPGVSGSEPQTVFELADGRRVAVRLHAEPLQTQRVSCRDEKVEAPTKWTLSELVALSH